ncbi:unnamed protein product [Diamesa tonsa]
MTSGFKELQTLELINCGITQLTESFFSHSKNINEINLSNNTIESLDDDLFKAQKQLTNLDLSNNQIRNISASSISDIASLRILKLSFNAITNVHEFAFQNLKNLEELHLDNNQLTRINLAAAKTHVTKLNTLILHHNKINYFFAMNMRNLTYLDLSYNEIVNFGMSDWSRISAKKLTLNLSHNLVKELNLTNTPHISVNSTTINLSYNQLERITLNDLQKLQDTFYNLQNLKELYLDNNQLTELNFAAAKSHVPKLQTLILTYNYIKTFFAMNMWNLTTLDLSYNKINNYSINDWSRTSQKEIIINLSHNLIDEIILRISSESSKVTMLLDNNPFVCDCRNAKLVEFLNNDGNSFYGEINSERFDYGGFYLIVLTNGMIQEIQQIFTLLWSIFIYNVNILVEDNDGNISMITFMPFKENECGQTTPTIINSYEVQFSSWKSQTYFPRKINNLFKCPIKIAIFESQPFLSMSKESGKIIGSDIELVNGLAEALNFRVDVNFMTEPGSWGTIHANGTSTGALRKVIDGDEDLTVGGWYLTQLRLKYMSNSESYYAMPLILVIPPGAHLTAFEKLFRPFHNLVWIVLILTLLFGVLIIFIIKLQSNEIKRFIFGMETSKPYFNMLIALAGDSQTVLPSRNFARFLLMIFLLFCLVIRTLYQGALFQFLQTDDREKEAQTIDELMDKGFDFYMYPSFQDLSQHLKFFKRKKVVNGSLEIYQKKTLDYRFKGCTCGPLSEVLYLNQQNYKNFTYKVLKEFLFTAQIVIYYTKNFYLKEEVNDKLLYMKASGLVDHWISKSMDMKYLNMKEPKHGPKKLNLQQLSGGFQVWLGGCFIGFSTFLCEHVYYFYNNYNNF